MCHTQHDLAPTSHIKNTYIFCLGYQGGRTHTGYSTYIFTYRAGVHMVPASVCLYKPIVYKHPSLSGLRGLGKGVEAHRCTALRPMIGIGIVWRATPCSQQG